MANRRMFSKDVIDSDRFLDMPPTAQNLYFHLGMQADDDGFVASPKKVKRASSATDDDLKLLEAKRFIISFESGVIVINDWKLNNYIQKDRYTSTIHLEEKNHIITTENRSYKYVDPPCIQDGYQMDTQYSIAKDSIGQVRKGKDSKAKDSIDQASVVKSRLGEKSTLSYADDAVYDSGTISLKDCIEFYQSEIGELGNFDVKTLERLSKEYGIDFLFESIEKTAFRDDVNSPLAYVTTLLQEWRRKGFNEIDDIENEQQEFNEQFE